MKVLPACFQARLDSFGWSSPKPKPKSKPRRTSARGKKASTVDDTPSWPLKEPVPYDLAFAGFLYKPTSASPDNVQCFDCGCQLDGWEESDIPAYEHLTHSPTCGFAINICIRLRLGDPDRVEEDPLSEKMKDARRATFADYWDLDVSAGFPSVEQMVEAGWYYDPAEDRPDGVTCPYCCLSLDSWEAGDDPLEEHRRRADTSNCLFFVLKELYHPANIPYAAKKGKRASSRGSRMSTNSVTATTTVTKKASTTTTKTKATTTKAEATAAKNKSTRAKATVKAPPPKPSRASKRQSKQIDTEPEVAEPSKPARVVKRKSEQTDVELDDAEPDDAVPQLVIAPKKRQNKQTNAEPAVAGPSKPARTKRQSKQIDVYAEAPARDPFPAPVRRASRKSEHTDAELELDAEPEDAGIPRLVIAPKAPKVPKRQSKAANAKPEAPLPQPPVRQATFPKAPVPEAPLQSTSSNAKKRGSEQIETEGQSPEFRRSKRTRTSAAPGTPDWPTFSPPSSMIAGTPPAVFQNATPPRAVTPESTTKWTPVDIEEFFEKENLPPIAALTSAEKQMTIEEFLMHEAKRQEDNLRAKMMEQIAALDAVYSRALTALDEM